MGLVEKFIGKTVFIDTSPFIYFIEGHSDYRDDLIRIFNANDNGQFKMITSVMTLLEVLVLPIKLKRSDLADEYEKILTTSPHLKMLQIDIETVKLAAQIRSEFNLKTPDAIQIATAIKGSASVFLTNDRALKKVKNIEVVTFQN